VEEGEKWFSADGIWHMRKGLLSCRSLFIVKVQLPSWCTTEVGEGVEVWAQAKRGRPWLPRGRCIGRRTARPVPRGAPPRRGALPRFWAQGKRGRAWLPLGRCIGRRTAQHVQLRSPPRRGAQPRFWAQKFRGSLPHVEELRRDFGLKANEGDPGYEVRI